MPWFQRFTRAFVAVLIAGAAQNYGDHPYYLLIAPILMSVGKFLRDKYGWKWLP